MGRSLRFEELAQAMARARQHKRQTRDILIARHRACRALALMGVGAEEPEFLGEDWTGLQLATLDTHVQHGEVDTTFLYPFENEPAHRLDDAELHLRKVALDIQD